MKSKPQFLFLLLLLGLFLFRTVFGLMSEFWFEDELQIYLIGLKSFTTQTWPYYGPDVVYTQTQVPGALQGLLVSAGWYLLPIPETPALVLNILSFASLSLFAWYLSKQLQNLPRWLIWAWVMTLTWTMDFTTRVVNPSYVIVFSIPFFIAFIELLNIFPRTVLSRRLSWFIAGITPFWIMQLHLSFVLLLPFLALTLGYEFLKKEVLKERLVHAGVFIAGIFLALLTVIPTWLFAEQPNPVESNIVFNIGNFKNILVVFTRYLSFASYEIPYILGGNTESRMAVISSNWWMAPFALYLLLFGFLLIASFLFVAFMRRDDKSYNRIKYLALAGYLIAWLSFFFSIKGPSSHTFCILLPLVVLFSMQCLDWLWKRFSWWKYLMYAALVSCIFFYVGLGIYNYQNKSLYKDRARVEQALTEKDYRVLGERRH